MIYAVNKVTKEHRVYHHPMDTGFWAECELVQADADGWIPWPGGNESPLPDGARCDVCYTAAVMCKNTYSGGSGAKRWRHTCSDYDIIAYRPILDTDILQGTEWNGEGLPPVGVECEYLYEGSSWRHGICVGRYNDKAVIVDTEDDGAECCPARGCRPIATAEEMAAEEMARIIYNCDSAGSLTPHAAARALYRAGYRKTN